MHNITTALEARPNGPRTFRRLRQRVKHRIERDTKSEPSRCSGDEEMGENDESPAEALNDRATLCLPDFARDSILHGGDERFKPALRQYYPSSESNAAEGLVNLKSRLKNASTHDFWGILVKGMCDIIGSQCAFVSKRMLVDDPDTGIEMPPLGEPGSCLMAIAFYVDNGAGVKELYRDYQYHAYGSPCAHMRHDKVFLIPERMTEFLPNNPIVMPWKQSEAFIGVPLFSEGKCFAHFGLIWSLEGAVKKKLSWGYIEMFMHSLEDMILQRILEDRGLEKEPRRDPTPANDTPVSGFTPPLSLQPYARSLSHELRTPMQGVVGMLDIMYATVLDAISAQQSEKEREPFKHLKSHIEKVQDSSRRAVEAADNVVHAYDLNMRMPEMPMTPDFNDSPNYMLASVASTSHTPNPEYGKLPSPVSTKRGRPDEIDSSGLPLKRMFTVIKTEVLGEYFPNSAATSCEVCGTVTTTVPKSERPSGRASPDVDAHGMAGSPRISSTLSANHRRIITREFMRTLLNDALQNDHPTGQVHTEAETGETIDVRTINSKGEVQEKTILLTVELGFPEVIITEDVHLRFALQKVIGNAIKFTDTGSIRITLKMSKNLQVVEIWVVDTGCGISEQSKLQLFKPHFQEDASISRARDGLGLSLFNAKARVRKNLGGDVTLERSATDGPFKGSEFLIRLPISTLVPANIDVPLVGAPLHGAFHFGPPTPNLESSTPGGPSIYGILDVRPGPAPRRSSAIPSHRRPVFNPNLAKEYPLNILIAEDNAINRNVAEGSLKKLGYTTSDITLAHDGAEAVQHFRESLSRPSEQKFNVILMDIWMPNMDGFEASIQISDLARQSGETTKIIAVTADITGDCMEKAEKVGMKGFLAKPYKVMDIERLIVEHFDKVVMCDGCC
ncbi:HHK17, histidine kinase-group VII protein [Venustampulla echinocandica]|uniref:histidine kinase n=1 Tax=Venustampulla echinocandica TaxID=2656787 RepID=A0A370TMS4_9HELO|nr:HHK17, histidine kinase-group VII protein [Venustampulla echinocandica]RDL36815.1 HHK17, histidine kinase-group VII protein [Venustampulla echinocandica]